MKKFRMLEQQQEEESGPREPEPKPAKKNKLSMYSHIFSNFESSDSPDEMRRKTIEKVREEKRQAEVRKKEKLEEEKRRREEEAELKRKAKEEEERLKKEKEETEKKSKEEAEKREAELQEKLKKEEEERLARKKRIEEIMARTRGKTAAPAPKEEPTATTPPPPQQPASLDPLGDPTKPDLLGDISDKVEAENAKNLTTPAPAGNNGIGRNNLTQRRHRLGILILILYLTSEPEVEKGALDSLSLKSEDTENSRY